MTQLWLELNETPTLDDDEEREYRRIKKFPSKKSKMKEMS
jgi:hypothetical protein